MISEKEVNHIANLARIKIKPEEIKNFQKDFSNILDYFNVLKKAKINKETKSDCLKAELREDEIIKFSSNVLNSIPSKKGDYVKVKKIF